MNFLRFQEIEKKFYDCYNNVHTHYWFHVLITQYNIYPPYYLVHLLNRSYCQQHSIFITDSVVNTQRNDRLNETGMLRVLYIRPCVASSHTCQTAQTRPFPDYCELSPGQLYHRLNNIVYLIYGYIYLVSSRQRSSRMSERSERQHLTQELRERYDVCL